MPFRPLLLALAVLCLGTASAGAIMWKDSTRAVADAEARRDFQTAFDEALVLALAGENTGYDILARYYANGTVVKANPAVAARIVCLAAERGDRNAQIRLARLYLDGKTLPQDQGRVLLWALIAGQELNGALKEQYGLNSLEMNASGQLAMADVDRVRALARSWTVEKAAPSDRQGRYCP
jgi:TPR repeat protein